MGKVACLRADPPQADISSTCAAANELTHFPYAARWSARCKFGRSRARRPSKPARHCRSATCISFPASSIRPGPDFLRPPKPILNQMCLAVPDVTPRPETTALLHTWDCRSLEPEIDGGETDACCPGAHCFCCYLYFARGHHLPAGLAFVKLRNTGWRPQG